MKHKLAMTLFIESLNLNKIWIWKFRPRLKKNMIDPGYSLDDTWSIDMFSYMLESEF